MAWQTGPGPHLAPGIPRDQILKFFGERIVLLDRPVHMLVAEDGTPDFQSFCIPLTTIHRLFSYLGLARNCKTSAENRRGISTFDRCAVSSSTYFESGMRSAKCRPPSGGVALSCVPAITSVGVRIVETSARKSASRIAAHVAA